MGLIFIAAVIFTAAPALAYVMSSTNYRIERDSINFSGSRSTASSYYLESTLGEAGTGIGLSALYKLLAGYQQNEAAVVVVCNNNGTCDSGETTANCSADCPSGCVGPRCFEFLK